MHTNFMRNNVGVYTNLPGKELMDKPINLIDRIVFESILELSGGKKIDNALVMTILVYMVMIDDDGLIKYFRAYKQVSDFINNENIQLKG